MNKETNKTEQIETTEEKVLKFYNYLNENLEYYKRLAIQYIQEDRKSDKVDNTKNIYLEITNRYNYLFKDELITAKVDEVIKNEGK